MLGTHFVSARTQFVQARNSLGETPDVARLSWLVPESSQEVSLSTVVSATKGMLMSRMTRLWTEGNLIRSSNCDFSE